ncbi:MAG: YdcF family protein [Candidatus Aminicenantes bacterium]
MKGVIILLGAPNDEKGSLSSIARERCERAVLEYNKRSGYKILPTGGFGSHFNVTDKPHGFYSSRYLISKGIPKEDILECVESSNTFEDAEFSWPIIQQYEVGRVVVVTSDFHVPRARIIFEKRFSKTSIFFAESKTHLSGKELDELKLKEKRALSRLRCSA